MVPAGVRVGEEIPGSGSFTDLAAFTGWRVAELWRVSQTILTRYLPTDPRRYLESGQFRHQSHYLRNICFVNTGNRRTIRLSLLCPALP